MRDIKTGAMLSALLLVSGCAIDPGRQPADAEYRQADWENRFVDYQRRCVRRGGTMFVSASGGLDRSGIPQPGAYYTYSLSMSIGPSG